jgi:hypothetical protein
MTNRNFGVLLAVTALSLCSGRAFGQFTMTWTTIDGGGGTCTGGGLTLNCTIGQPDAGPVMTGGTFTFTGGFWTGVGGTTGPHCGTADFNCDGDIGTDSDIAAFFACLSGSCPPPPCTNSADFNGDGDLGTDADIEAFFRVLSGGTC